jgi:nucleoside-diphosphate-sugar epimerase
VAKVLVSGGGGYIGSVLCRELLGAGHEVVCLDRFFFGTGPVDQLAEVPGFQLLRADIRTATPDMLAGVDAVMDLAGISNDPACELDPELTEGINVVGSLHLARLARDAGVSRYIYSSSCSVYGAGGDGVMDERSALHPVSLYAEAKVKTEQGLLAMGGGGFTVTILRNATAYGLSPRMRFDLLVNIMTAYAVTRGKIFILGGGKQWRPLVHVRDVARAFLLALEAPVTTVAGAVFNVGSDAQNYRVEQVASMVKAALPTITIERAPDDADKRSYHVGFSHIAEVLGFTPAYDVRDGIAEVSEALANGQVSLDDIRTSTVKYYTYLIEAERVLADLRLDGRLF